MARLVQEDNKHGETRLELSYGKPVYMARLVQEDNKHGKTRLELSYSKPVCMARLVQEDNKHGETRLELSYSKRLKNFGRMNREIHVFSVILITEVLVFVLCLGKV
jgi:hypothetical protein